VIGASVAEQQTIVQNLPIIRNFHFSLGKTVTPNASSPRVLNQNELIFNTVFYDSDVTHEYDVTESRDVIGDVTNRRAIGTFL